MLLVAALRLRPLAVYAVVRDRAGRWGARAGRLVTDAEGEVDELGLALRTDRRAGPQEPDLAADRGAALLGMGLLVLFAGFG